MPNFKNIFHFIKWFIKEIIKTFSNEPSYFSSKRVERMIIFVNAMLCLDIMIAYMLKNDKIDYVAACAIYAAQMVYAGYNTSQIYKEKPKTSLEVKQEGGDSELIAKTTENAG